MSKIIIGVHGLGNKPPAHILHNWWRKSITDGFRIQNHTYLPYKFDLVYWANFIHAEPLDPDQTDRDHPLFLEDPYSKAGKIERGRGKPLKKKIKDYLEKQIDKLLLNEDLSINFAKITDFIIHHFFHDLEIYCTSNCPGENYSDYLAREAIREKLAETIRAHRNDQILLIGHSMGSIIAYDIMTQLVPDIPIDTFITCGSPLGIPVIMRKFRAEQKITDPDQPLRVPENVIHHWYNLSDLDDKVAMNYNLADDYQPSVKGIGITDIQVSNTYEYQGEKNPHKAYGYLRTPEIAEIIYDFCAGGQPLLWIWVKERLNQFLKINLNK